MLTKNHAFTGLKLRLEKSENDRDMAMAKLKAVEDSLRLKQCHNFTRICVERKLFLIMYFRIVCQIHHSKHHQKAPSLCAMYRIRQFYRSI